MILRSTIVAEARKLVGVQYKHQGRSVARGLDCIGLVWLVAKNVGYDRAIPGVYAPLPSANLLQTAVDQHLTKVERTPETIRPGDIMLMWSMEHNQPQHFAFVGDDGGRFTMIHALSRFNKVVEHGIDRAWMKRMVSVYNIPETED